MSTDASRSPADAAPAGGVREVSDAEVVRRPPFGDNPAVGLRGATTHRAILAAALSAFAEHGFHDTKVEHITEAAGCSRPAFYQYYASKNDVFWRLAGHLARDLSQLVDEVGEIKPDAESVAMLDRWMDRLVGLHESYQPIFQSFETAFRAEGGGHPLPPSLSAGLRGVLLDADDRHGFLRESVDVGPLAETIVSTVLRTIHFWLLGLLPVERGRFTLALASTVHRVIFGPIAGVNTGPVADRPPTTTPDWPTTGVEMPERPLRPRGIATRQKLLDAASAILPRRGYHRTRVDDIVAEAGCAHGSFYRYFDSTDDLFGVLAIEASRQMADLIEQFATAPSGALHDWLTRWFATYRSNGGVISAWQEIVLGDDELTTMSLDVVAVFVDRLERLVATRGFGDTSVDALVLLSLIERVPYSVVVLARLDEGPAIAAAQHAIERGILAPP